MAKSTLVRHPKGRRARPPRIAVGAERGALPVVRERQALSAHQSTALAGLFDVLANDTRLRLLHALVQSDELCVTDLAEEVGSSVQAVSNQLTRLTALRVVAARRDGVRMLYRIVDPCVSILLDRGLCIAEDAGRCGQHDSGA